MPLTLKPNCSPQVNVALKFWTSLLLVKVNNEVNCLVEGFFSENVASELLLSSVLMLHIFTFESESKVTQSCPTFCDPMDYSLPGSSVHGIFQAIRLECIAISFSRGSSQPRDWTWVSRIVDRCFNVWATREVEIFTFGWYQNILESYF